jgi:hypothetical protein
MIDVVRDQDRGPVDGEADRGRRRKGRRFIVVAV